MKKNLSIAIIACMVMNYSFAQLNVQVYGTYVRNLNKEFSGNTTGAGIRLEYGHTAITYFAGFSFAKAIITKQELEARAYSSWTEPSYVMVTALYKLPMNRIEAGMRYYITGDPQSEEGINVFFDIRGELIFFKNNPKYSYFNKDDYMLGVVPDEDINEDGTPTKFNDVFAGIGLGLEKKLGPGYVFLHSGISLPIFKTYADGSTSEVGSMSPIPLNLSLGYKVFLFRRSE